MAKVKINEKPKNYKAMAARLVSPYDKYKMAGLFTRKEFLKLLSKVKSQRKKELIALKERHEEQDFAIELQYATGTYKLQIPTNMDASKYFWATDYVCKIFDVEKKTIDRIGTVFEKRFDSFKYLQLQDFFIKLNGKSDKKWFDEKEVVDIDNVKVQGRNLLLKINMFVEMLIKIETRIRGDAALKKIKVNDETETNHGQ